MCPAKVINPTPVWLITLANFSDPFEALKQQLVILLYKLR